MQLQPARILMVGAGFWSLLSTSPMRLRQRQPRAGASLSAALMEIGRLGLKSRYGCGYCSRYLGANPMCAGQRKTYPSTHRIKDLLAKICKAMQLILLWGATSKLETRTWHVRRNLRTCPLLSFQKCKQTLNA